MEHFAAYIGLDWSDQKHDLCLVDTRTGEQEASVIKHTPDALNGWAASLRALSWRTYAGRRADHNTATDGQTPPPFSWRSDQNQSSPESTS